jgi:hypothetical protein
MVTFKQIAETWEVIRKSHEDIQDEFFSGLTSPETREWFLACASAVSNGPPLERPFPRCEECIDALGLERSRIARAHLACARAAWHARNFEFDGLLHQAWKAFGWLQDARENFVYETTGDLLRDEVVKGSEPMDWQGLASAVVAELSPNETRWPGVDPKAEACARVNAAFKLLGRHLSAGIAWQQYLAEAWNLVLEMLGGDRTVARTVHTFALLVEERPGTAARVSEGVVPTLVLECLDDGFGVLYPAPPMAFVTRPRIRRLRGTEIIESREFRQAEDHACEFARSKIRVWDGSRDVRWRLKSRKSSQRLPLEISGSSAGAAFAVALAKVLLPE